MNLQRMRLEIWSGIYLTCEKVWTYLQLSDINRSWNRNSFYITTTRYLTMMRIFSLTVGAAAALQVLINHKILRLIFFQIPIIGVLLTLVSGKRCLNIIWMR